METKEGLIQAIKPGRLVVRLRRDGVDCEGCSHCAARGLCRSGAYDHMDIAVPVSGGEAAGLAVGDPVRIEYETANAAIAGLALFVPPMLGLALGGYAGYRAGAGGSGWFLAGCAFGLAAGALVTFALSRMKNMATRGRLLRKGE